MRHRIRTISLLLLSTGTLGILAIASMLSILLCLPTSALAISQANGTYIENVWAYENCIETGDQLYIVDWTIDYDTNPAEPADEAYLFVFYNSGDVQLDSVVPNPYYDRGYARGVVSFYFDASSAPTWEDEGSYIILSGNPALDWVPSAPSVTKVGTDFSWQSNAVTATQKVISDRIMWLAMKLDQDWDAAYSLIQYTSEGNFLSDNGVEYFSAVIEYLKLVAPESLNWRQLTLDYDRTDPMYDWTHDYSGDLEDTIADTPLDLTDAADIFGMSRGMFTGAIYYGMLFLGIAAIYRKSQVPKMLMPLTILFVILGAFVGVPLIVTIIAGFCSMLATAYALFYKNAAT